MVVLEHQLLRRPTPHTAPLRALLQHHVAQLAGLQQRLQHVAEALLAAHRVQEGPPAAAHVPTAHSAATPARVDAVEGRARLLLLVVVVLVQRQAVPDHRLRALADGELVVCVLHGCVGQRQLRHARFVGLLFALLLHALQQTAAADALHDAQHGGATGVLGRGGKLRISEAEESYPADLL